MNKFKQHILSIFILSFSNIIILLSAVILKWNIMLILAVYWIEAVMIGFYNILKIIFLAKSESQSIVVFIIVNTLAGLFFIFHFSIMAGLVGFFINFTSEMLYNETLKPVSVVIKTWPSLFCLFGCHAFIFIRSYILKGERKRSSIFIFLFLPYIRLMIISTVLTLGTVLVLKYKEKIFFLLILIAAKITADILSHFIEKSITAFVGKKDELLNSIIKFFFKQYN